MFHHLVIVLPSLEEILTYLPAAAFHSYDGHRLALFYPSEPELFYILIMHELTQANRYGTLLSSIWGWRHLQESRMADNSVVTSGERVVY